MALRDQVISMSNYNLKAKIEDEHIDVEFETEDAALAAKQALNDAGHDAGVYLPVHQHPNDLSVSRTPVDTVH